MGFKDEWKKMKSEFAGINKQFKEDSKKIKEDYKKDTQKTNQNYIDTQKDNNEQAKKEIDSLKSEPQKSSFTTAWKEQYRIEKEKEAIKREDKNRPKLKLDILNGSKELGFLGNRFEMIQTNPGEVQFKVDGNLKEHDFNFLKFDRTENIKKSALDTAGWTFAGNMLWGKAGALAAGLGSQAGKDKSTAALFLINKDTNKKLMLIIKCDSKVLEKLSRFTLSQEDLERQPSSSTDKYQQLEQIGKLKEKGILTEEEFQHEKNRVLNN
ncbi:MULTISPECIES: hypothetical protein [unclassified Oceanobacillus]|uniref:hypothetical protein n=1 Tax=unclassified Oceanobacillus TaxID=2630292 RepID=UPI001BEC77F8|nr:MULTISPECIES: hypothetical protein [unclassified Oceanobacillus]MBT2599067.1 hypothetical protein [Oceanobacillus sp. ISL-74]MBT2651985.1 hypothetical protein [Oceanobacillus sp. ISL-73]